MSNEKLHGQGHSRAFCDCPPRRGFLSGLGALGAAALLPGCSTPGAAAAGAAYRIDTHHHLYSPAYVAELAKVNQALPPARNWSLAKTLEDMEKAGVATSIASVTTPQVQFADAPGARRIARESNEWIAKVARDHPGRFGSFIMLPMQDIDGSLEEIAYGLDVLKADGVGVLTSYGDKWLGHASFAPIMNELNRRKAILYTHPTVANCCHNLIADTPPAVVEFGTDTTRSIVDLVFSGTAARCPDVNFIFSHAGGTMPFLTERLVRMPVLDPRLNARVPNGVLHELRRFYYDTAWSAHPGALASLMKLVNVSQVLFGSDYPFRTGEDHVKGIIEFGYSEADLRAIGRGNAVRLMPKWRA
jgi:6-methylsalicylate decarboxylase